MSYKIYDCFMYYDEDLLLDFRLNYLSPFVHKFVIVEANYTHSGKKRKLHFNINKYLKFKEKIIYIPIYEKPEKLNLILKEDSDRDKDKKFIINGYLRENFQRNQIKLGLNDAKDEDIVIVSDLDEIPNIEDLDFDKIKKKIIIFKQFFLFYKFNLFYKKRSWYGPRACRKKNLINPQWLRDIKIKKYSIFRPDILFSQKKYNSIFIVKNGGWHFTNLKDPKKIHDKFSNYLHHREFEYSNIKIKDIKSMIKNKISIYNHEVDKSQNKFDGTVKLYKLSNIYLPKYLVKNISKYKAWFN